MDYRLIMLSVVIITKNEAHNIRRCLESVKWADDIVVIDSGSEDGTVAIAKEYTNNVWVMDWQGYGVQKQRALEKATGDWVLNLDADESLTEPLKEEIQRVMADDSADACRIPIQMNFYGKPLRYSSSPSRHIRLFKREGARYSNDIVHEKIQLSKQHTRITQLKSAIVHPSFRDVSHALYKINRYSSYSAKIRIENHRSTALYKILLGTSWMFFRCYVLQRGFMDGKAGFLMACFNAQGTFYRGVKQLYRDADLAVLP